MKGTVASGMAGTGLGAAPAEPTVSIVIPTFNRRNDLARTLKDLIAQRFVAFEVIIIDNSSADGTDYLVATMVNRFGKFGDAPRLQYARKEPEGPAAARNLGTRLARGRYVLYLDSDVTLAPDWLEVCVAELERAPDVAAVGGKVVYADRPERLNSYGGELSRIGLAWDSMEGGHAAEARAPADKLWMNCTAMLARRDAVDAVGMFDEAYFYGFEDSDLGWRFNLAGHRVRLLPQAIAYHHVGDTVSRANPIIVFHGCKNRLRSMLVNCSAASLAVYLPLHLGYALTDALLRPPRCAKLRGLTWNLVRARNALRRRRFVQRCIRRVSDRDLSLLFSSRLFPERRLAGLRRRPTDPGGADVAPLLGDDRV